MDCRGKKIWKVRAHSPLSGKCEHFGFYASRELAKRVENFARACAFGRLSGGLAILAEEDPYLEDCLKTRAGWRLKGLPQGAVHIVEEEFNPKACIEAVQAMVKSDKKRPREDAI